MAEIKPFTVISTFSGCGGSSLGYQLAGGKALLAVEWDNNAVETYKANFPDTPIFHGDIAKLSVEKILELTGIKESELDIFDGSPPCQGFSTAGKRVIDDPRNSLFKEYVRLLRGLKPKVFVMENVSGMVKGKMKLVFAQILKELKESGYQVKARLLNAMYFNVPQSRQRIIFIGVRNDLGIEPSYPKPSSLPLTIGKALDNVIPLRFAKYTTEYQLKVWNAVPPGDNLSQVKTTFCKFGSGFNSTKLSPRMVCPTICKSATYSKVALMHWKEPRSMAIEELQVLSSFPLEYKFAGSFDECWGRIGNSVPPNFMKAIAEHINKEILSQYGGVIK